MGNGSQIVIGKVGVPAGKRAKPSVFSRAHWRGKRTEALGRFEVLGNHCLIPAGMQGRMMGMDEMGTLEILWIGRGLFKRKVMGEIMEGAVKVERGAGDVVGALGEKYVECCTKIIQNGRGKAREAAFAYLMWAAENGGGELKRAALKGVAARIVRTMVEMQGRGDNRDAMKVEAEATEVLGRHLEEREMRALLLEAINERR